MFSLETAYTGFSLQRLVRHIFYWLLWLVFFAVVNSNYNDESFWTWIQVELVVMTVKIPFTYFVIYYLVPRFLIRKAYLTFAALMILLATVGGFAIFVLDIFFISPVLLNCYIGPVISSKIGYKILDLIYTSSLPTILKLMQHYLGQEKINHQITEEKLGAELKLLQNQLQPHFLFNTLNNLYGMVLTQDKRSPQVVLRLSEMLSYMLYENDRESIGLEKEIELLDNYIELEKVRHGNRLDLTFTRSGEPTGKRIAPLLMLPLVENAFKHGIEKDEQNCWIKIDLTVQDDALRFTVENSLPITAGGTETTTAATAAIEDKPVKTVGGIGLENIRKRLALLYPDKHELNIRADETHFVELSLSFK